MRIVIKNNQLCLTPQGQNPYNRGTKEAIWLVSHALHVERKLAASIA